VTGATGSLGAHVVAQLVLLNDVKKVYCLVRASSHFDARIRVIRSLRARSLYHCLPLTARAKILALPSNLGDASLGLEEKTYSRVSSEITSLIHCAWSVNFNLGLGSFEADCIAGEQIKNQLLALNLD
jgi:thioester reductase-like protein